MSVSALIHMRIPASPRVGIRRKGTVVGRVQPSPLYLCYGYSRLVAPFCDATLTLGEGSLCCNLRSFHQVNFSDSNTPGASRAASGSK